MRYCLLFLISLTAFPALAQSDAQQAFSAGLDSGSNTRSVSGMINDAKGRELIEGYGTQPAESSQWGGLQTPLAPVVASGNAKIDECETTGSSMTDQKRKQHCEAVKAINSQSKTGNPMAIKSDDPLIQKGKEIANDPAAIAGMISTTYSGCTEKQVSEGRDKVVENCEEYATNEPQECVIGSNVVVDADHLYKCQENLKSASTTSCSVEREVEVDADHLYKCQENAKSASTTSCSVGREVEVDADHLYSCLQSVKAVTGNNCTVDRVVTVDVDYNYQCQQSTAQVSQQTCNKILTVNVIKTPGCTPGSLLARITIDVCPWCPDYGVFDYYCQAGYYQEHLYTLSRYTGGLYSDAGTINIPGTPGAYIPQTITRSVNNGYQCYSTYYAQSCDSNNCQVSAWFSNPCQGTAYAGSSIFAMSFQVSFQDSWEDQCTSLASRVQ